MKIQRFSVKKIAQAAIFFPAFNVPDDSYPTSMMEDPIPPFTFLPWSVLSPLS